jgi:ribosomal protein L37AE/L43A
MKKEVKCKQCGKTFVKYAYEKIARCEDCRRLNRMGALGLSVQCAQAKSLVRKS